jgi:hypothetical protein
MKLLAAGDSFTNGMELTNPNLSWPYVLADKLGMTATNLGFDGSSNSRIVKSVVTADVKKYDLVIVAWSHYDRLAMADEMGIWDTWPGGQRTCYREAKFRIDFVNYYTRHHDDDYLYQHYLLDIILLQNFLDKNNINYLMCDAFGNHRDQRRFAVENQSLIDQIDVDKFLGWPYQSMQEWIGDAPIGPRGHFLELGHQRVADKFYEILSQHSEL